MNDDFDIDGWLADLEEIYRTSAGIAAEMGVTPGVISQWRAKRAIPADKQLWCHLLHPRKFPRERLSDNALPPRYRRARDTPAVAA